MDVSPAAVAMVSAAGVSSGWGVHTHETYFRDGANGFLMWAAATVLAAAVLSSAASSLIGGTVRSAAAVAGGAAQGATQAAADPAANPLAYFVDTMFRSETPDANATDQDVRSETVGSWQKPEGRRSSRRR